MVVILKCQEGLIKAERDSEDYRLFAIALVCSLLDTFEVDLAPGELREIEQFANDWCKE